MFPLVFLTERLEKGFKKEKKTEGEKGKNLLVLVGMGFHVECRFE